jgi:NIPSNAP
MILDRRQFLGGLPALMPAALAAAPAEATRTRFYVFEQYFLENGTQPARINEFFSKALLPAMDRIHKGPKIFLEAVMTPHMPQVAAIFGVESPEQAWSISKALFADKEFSRAFDQWETGEQPYVSTTSSLLEATDYSPEIVAPEKPPAAPRVFELRVYHSPTVRQNKLLHQRFSNAEIKIFHRVGVNPILYTTTVFGANRPNLTYLIPFDTLAAREKAWTAFSADEEWVRVRKESVDRGGQISSVYSSSLYKAMPYSPIL